MEEIPKDDAPSIGVEKERRASEDITGMLLFSYANKHFPLSNALRKTRRR